jgi:hypothetical protein
MNLLQCCEHYFLKKCYSALCLDESQPHDREWTLWITCYSALSTVTVATTEDPDPRYTWDIDGG